MTKKRFLLALALMLTAVGGAWAQGNTTPVNWNAATRTGSLTTPAGNVTLSVDYYGQYRLDSIPQGWQVKVNGSLMGSDTLKTYTDGGNPQMRYIAAINETDSVELLPPDSLKAVIKSVRLVEPAPAVVEPITVTINQSDWGNAMDSFTKDGVTVSAGFIDAMFGDLLTGGSFSTTLGNFTSIVVTTSSCDASGTGWSGCSWSGTPAPTVSFGGSFYGMGQVQTTIVCTIQPNN